MIFPTLNFSTLNFSRQQNIFRAPKNREASISLHVDRCRVNAKDMLLAKKKSSAIDRGIGATFDFLKNIGRASKKLFGPRKARCVDFSRQTYSKRCDFFDRFRSMARDLETCQTGCGWGWAGLGWLARLIITFIKDLCGIKSARLINQDRSQDVDNPYAASTLIL